MRRTVVVLPYMHRRKAAMALGYRLQVDRHPCRNPQCHLCNWYVLVVVGPDGAECTLLHALKYLEMQVLPDAPRHGKSSYRYVSQLPTLPGAKLGWRRMAQTGTQSLTSHHTNQPQVESGGIITACITTVSCNYKFRAGGCLVQVELRKKKKGKEWNMSATSRQ